MKGYDPWEKGNKEGELCDSSGFWPRITFQTTDQGEGIQAENHGIIELKDTEENLGGVK